MLVQVLIFVPVLLPVLAFKTGTAAVTILPRLARHNAETSSWTRARTKQTKRWMGLLHHQIKERQILLEGVAWGCVQLMWTNAVLLRESI